MRILVVDDNKEITDFLKKALQAECYVVDVADNGKDGSFLARTNEYDSIILDINLPQKSGLVVCKEIRDDRIETPILILSVQDEVPTKLDLFTAGADDYLTKPFSFQELLARLKAIARRPHKIEKEMIQIGDLVIDTSKNSISYQGKSVPLTRKEYIMLEYFGRHKDKVISRGDLMEHAWDMNADPFSNMIEVHIRNIRKKLASLTDKSILKTVSGRGYMLVSNELFPESKS